MSICLSRMTYPHMKQHFGDGFHVFYMETFCGNPIQSGEVCALCSKKGPTRTQWSRQFDHGLISGELSPHSHIFGSEWYNKKVATYGTPSQAVVELAMEAQRRTRNRIRGATKQKLVVRRKASTPTSIASSDSSVVDQLRSSVMKRTPSESSMAESMDDPISIQGVMRIKLKATVVDGMNVWLDESSGSVYERIDGQPRGMRLGSWDGQSFTEGSSVSCV